jgi:hypothetical protein
MPTLSSAAIIEARGSTGAMGNIPMAALRKRAGAATRWNRLMRRRFSTALTRLTKRTAR